MEGVCHVTFDFVLQIMNGSLQSNRRIVIVILRIVQIHNGGSVLCHLRIFKCRCVSSIKNESICDSEKTPDTSWREYVVSI